MSFDLIYVHPSGGRIYQGAKADVPTAMQYSDIDAIVFAADEYQPRWNKSAGRMRKKIALIHAPMDDEFYPTDAEEAYIRATSDRASDKVVDLVRNGKKVLITCRMGWNRSGLITGLSIKKLTGWPGSHVIKIVQRNRDNALGNPAFCRIIKTKKVKSAG